MGQEQIMSAMEEHAKSQKLELLREMYNEVDNCFDDNNKAWELKNFIDSFAREL